MSAWFEIRRFWVTRTSVIILLFKGGFISSAIYMEAVDLPASASLGLKRSESEQREPVRMILAGHQLTRALALAFSSPAAQEAPIVQEEAQQVKVWVAQMAPQREVVAQPRVEVL